MLDKVATLSKWGEHLPISSVLEKLRQEYLLYVPSQPELQNETVSQEVSQKKKQSCFPSHSLSSGYDGNSQKDMAHSHMGQGSYLLITEAPGLTEEHGVSGPGPRSEFLTFH